MSGGIHKKARIKGFGRSCAVDLDFYLSKTVSFVCYFGHLSVHYPYRAVIGRGSDGGAKCAKCEGLSNYFL